MDTMIIAVLSVLAFTLCCRQLIATGMKPVPTFNYGPYTKSALKVKKTYMVFAWTAMTGLFLIGLIHSFYQVYIEL